MPHRCRFTHTSTGARPLPRPRQNPGPQYQAPKKQAGSQSAVLSWERDKGLASLPLAVGTPETQPLALGHLYNPLGSGGLGFTSFPGPGLGTCVLEEPQSLWPCTLGGRDLPECDGLYLSWAARPRRTQPGVLTSSSKRGGGRARGCRCGGGAGGGQSCSLCLGTGCGLAGAEPEQSPQLMGARPGGGSTRTWQGHLQRGDLREGTQASVPGLLLPPQTRPAVSEPLGRTSISLDQDGWA